jgi:tetratricopeptide (TPR) repeat protein
VGCGELGVTPGPELTAAHLRVLRQDLPAPRGVAAPRMAAGPGHRAEPPVAPAQLPPDVADFTGRERELQRLHSLIRAVGPEATALPIVLLSGPPGVGKTALAVHWGHQVADSYVDGSLYVDLRGHSPDPPLSPTDALRHLLLGCGVAHADLPPEPEAAGALVRSILAGRRVLIVLDNAASAAQIRPLLPGKGGCLVLVTSRDRLDGLVARQGARRIDLGALTGAESVALLTRVLGERVRAEPDDTAELAALCGGLPLALRIAAAHLTGVPATIASYAAGLRTGDRVAQLAIAGDEASAGIEVAFDRSYAGLSTAARRLFRLAGLAPGADFTVDAVATLANVPPGRAEAVLDRLAQAHLVQRLAPRRYRFHDLIRCYAVHRCQAEDTTVVRDGALLRLVRAYAGAATAAAGLLYPQLMRLHHPRVGAGAGQFIGHAEALAWFEAERANLVAAVRVAAPYRWPEVAHLAYAARGYLEHRRHLDDLMEMAHAGLAVATATGDGRGEASAWMSLAIAHGSRAEFDLARQEFLTALRTARRNGWPDIVAVAHNNLGVMYAQLGQLDEAARHYRGALAGYRRIGWDVGQGSCLTSLGNVCYRRGQLTDAVGYQTEAMELADRIGAVGVAAIARENLARACLALGRTETALSHLAPALVRFRQVGNAPGEAAVLHLQAVAHLAAGDLARCEQLAASAMTIAQDTGDSAAEVDIHNTWGELGLRRGRPSAAADAYRRALHLAGVRGHRFGEVEALIGLAGAQAALGDPAAGLAAGRRALSRAQRQGYLVLEGRAGAALAHIYASCGRTGPAARHLERALGRRRETGDRACEARLPALLTQLRAGLADHPALAAGQPAPDGA